MCTAHRITFIGIISVVPMLKKAHDCSFHRARVASEVDASPRQLPYQQSDVLALLQPSELRQEAVQHSIQQLQR